MLIGAWQKKFAVQEIATVAARPRNDTVVCTQYNIVSLYPVQYRFPPAQPPKASPAKALPAPH